MDGSGQHCTASFSAGIYVSQNFGLSWTQSNAPSGRTWKLASNPGSGQYVVAGSNGGGLYLSSNYGVSFTLNSQFGSAGSFAGVVTDGSGAFIAVASSTDAKIWLSSNYGSTWTASGAPGSQWSTIVCDYTCQHLAAGVQSGGIYVSADYGVSWTLSGAASASYYQLASDYTGEHL
eukprot:gene45310-56436_t